MTLLALRTSNYQSIHINITTDHKSRNPRILGMHNKPNFWIRRRVLDRAEETREGRHRLGVHTDDDDEGDESVVGRHLRQLHCPRRPLLHTLHVPIAVALRLALPLPLRRCPGRHWFLWDQRLGFCFFLFPLETLERDMTTWAPHLNTPVLLITFQ